MGIPGMVPSLCSTLFIAQLGFEPSGGRVGVARFCGSGTFGAFGWGTLAPQTEMTRKGKWLRLQTHFEVYSGLELAVKMKLAVV